MKHSADSVLITAFDLRQLFTRLWPLLKFLALCAFCLTFFSLLFKEPQFLAKASFKHLHKQNDFPSLSKEIFKELALPSQNAPIFSVMHSNQVLRSTIEHLGMQMLPDLPLFSWKTVMVNLCNELGIRKRHAHHFSFEHVHFDKEKTLKIYIRPLTSESYEILNKKKEVIGIGELGKGLRLQSCQWTLKAYPRHVQYNQLYSFKIIPWAQAVENVKKKFEIRAHKLDKQVFNLYFAHSNRYLAAQFLNQVMQSYQHYHQRENEEIYETQLTYLDKRQKELIDQFAVALAEHTHYLQTTIQETGCIGFVSEYSALSESQKTFNEKLFDVGLELNRFESVYANPLLSLSNTNAMQKRIDTLTLESAKTLYLQYIEKKDRLEAQVKERAFLCDRLTHPDFEISSLSTFLTDPVSMSLAQNASAIALKMRDGENRTAREQQRLKEELDTQKHSLHQHLKHIIALEELQLQLLSYKIDGLKLETRDLLDAEKLLLENKITQLHQKMASLPEKWRRECLLLLKKDVGARIIGSISQLVETKNLNQKLYQASAKNLDSSSPPFKAKHPHLFLSSLSAAFLICLAVYTYHLCTLVIKT